MTFQWAEARPGWPIIVESIKNNDIPSIMHEASHILLRKGKQNKIYEKEEILCLFIEAMFREKIYGKFESKSKREELKILREDWNKRNNFANIIDFAKNILQYCK